jgi:VWFA-related protein
MKVAAAVLFLIATAPAASAQDPGRVRENAEVSLVEVPVRVTDRDGRPIRGLTAKDFTLAADGHPRRSSRSTRSTSATPRWTPARSPRPRAAASCCSSTSPSRGPRSIVGARRAAAEFVTRQIGPEDLAAVATYSVENGFRLLVTFSSDRAQLARAIDTLGIDAKREPADPLGFSLEPRSVAIAALERGAEASRNETTVSALVDSLEAMTALQKAQSDEYSRSRVRTMVSSFGDLARSLDSVEGRKDVVLLSEGFQSRLLVGATETTQERDWLVNGRSGRSIRTGASGTSRYATRSPT